MADERPNVLFVLTDQWRHDALGCCGHRLVQTPNLDRLADRSVVFEHAFTTVPLCSPARGTLLTGLWPHQSGMEDNVGVGASLQEALDADCATWLDAAVASGFRVGYYGKWHLGEDGPISRGAHGYTSTGFDRHRPAPGCGEAPATESGKIRAGVEQRYAQVKPGGKPPFYGVLEGSVRDTQTGRTADEAIGFLDGGDDRPWFLTVSFHGPHFPHLVPEPFASSVDWMAVDLPESLSDDFADKSWFQNRTWWPCHDTSRLTHDDWRKTAAAYYGLIAMVDAEIGRVLAAAERAHGGRETVVVFASDHGEMLGAHNWFDKGPFFYHEVMRIPLMISLPDMGSDTRLEFVNLIDLSATLFGLAGGASEGPGRDLVALIRGDSLTAYPDEAFGWYNAYNGHSFALRSIRTPAYRYSFNPQDVDELYDLRTDPHECINVVRDSAYQAVLGELRERVFQWMEREGDPLADCWWELPPAGRIGGSEMLRKK